MMTPENLPVHELIGLRARVAKSLSAPHRGLSGIVVDETKNTLVLSKDGREIVVPKRGCTFSFTISKGKRVAIEGMAIAFRPYDRPKKIRLK